MYVGQESGCDQTLLLGQSHHCHGPLERAWRSTYGDEEIRLHLIRLQNQLYGFGILF